MADAVKPKALTLPEAASYARVSLNTIKRNVAAGRLATVRIGRRVVVLVEDLDAFLGARRATTWPTEGPSVLRLVDAGGAVVADGVEVEGVPEVGQGVPGTLYRVVKDEGVVQDVRFVRRLVVEPAR
jgi:excisionase family DNA binding protein